MNEFYFYIWLTFQQLKMQAKYIIEVSLFKNELSCISEQSFRIMLNESW